MVSLCSIHVTISGMMGRISIIDLISCQQTKTWYIPGSTLFNCFYDNFLESIWFVMAYVCDYWSAHWYDIDLVNSDFCEFLQYQFDFVHFVWQTNQYRQWVDTTIIDRGLIFGYDSADDILFGYDFTHDRISDSLLLDNTLISFFCSQDTSKLGDRFWIAKSESRSLDTTGSDKELHDDDTQIRT